MAKFMKKYTAWISIFSLMLILFGSITGCDSNSSTIGGANPTVSADTKSIIKYDLAKLPSTIVGNNISVILPYGGTVKNLVSTFTITGVKTTVNGVTQVSGKTANSFDNPVVYTVYAANGSTKEYTVTLIIPATSDKDMKTYSLNGTPGQIAGTNISVILPYGTPSLDGLVATYITTGSYVMVDGTKQTSGETPNNFENPVIYTVYATDGSTKNYTVTATIAPNTAKDITAYSIDGTTGAITGNNISVKLPYDTSSLNDLIATFTTTGSYVKVGSITQTSGETPNNLESPVKYTVYAGDGSTKSYTVTATTAPSSAKDITAYSIDSTTGVITGNNISVTLPYGIPSLKDLTAIFTTTGSYVKVGNITQQSGETKNNFESPVVYMVYAADGSTKNYTVTVLAPMFVCINDPVTDNACGCLLQNDGSGLIWYASGAQQGLWTDWCSPSLDGRCNSTGSSLIEFNSKNHCGYNDWQLPTATKFNVAYVDQIGGQWGSLGTYAKNNGWVQNGNFATWLTVGVGVNHFTDVTDGHYFIASSFDQNDWRSVFMTRGIMLFGPNQFPAGVLLVHSSQ